MDVFETFGVSGLAVEFGGQAARWSVSCDETLKPGALDFYLTQCIYQYVFKSPPPPKVDGFLPETRIVKL